MLTPDSFYDGNITLINKDLKNIFNDLNKCDIIDIGAESSRPGDKIHIHEEKNRIIKSYKTY